MESNLLNKPLWQMTGEELLELNRQSRMEAETPAIVVEGQPTKKYVYGIAGIALLFGCSKPTANRIKKNGKIDAAIKQIGRKIIVDAELALELARMIGWSTLCFTWFS